MMLEVLLDEQLEFLIFLVLGQGFEDEIFMFLLNFYFEGNVGVIWLLNEYILFYIDGLDVEWVQIVMDQQVELLLDVCNE